LLCLGFSSTRPRYKKKTKARARQHSTERERERDQNIKKNTNMSGEEDAEKTISFIVKTSTNPKLEMKNVKLSATVAELKAKLATKMDEEKNDGSTTLPDSIRLIYKGHVLKDEKTVRECSIGEGHAVHLVKSAPKKSATTTTTTTPGGSGSPATTTNTTSAANNEGGAAAAAGNSGQPPRTWMDDANASQRTTQAPDFATLFNSSVLGGGAGGSGGFGAFGGGGSGGGFGGGFGGAGGMPNPTPEEIRAIENDPFVRQFMEQAMQDPEVLRPMMQMMEQNPQIQQLMNANPELRQAMQDPETISRALRAYRDPNLMREQMAANDRTFANIESHPEGFNALRRMYENVEVPLQNAIQNSQNSEADANNNNNGAAADANPFASLFGAASSSGNATANSDAPLPNPWAAANSGTAGASTSQTRQQNPFAGLGGMGGMGGFGGMGMPDEATMRRQMEAIQNNPALMQMFSQTMSQIASDPNALDSLRRSNPEFDAMLRQQPHLAEQMRNPEFLRALADPQTLQAMAHLQRVMGGGAGGGFGGSPFGGMGASAPVTPPADPETAYAVQISQLNDMGFFDPAENVRALVATNGNVSAAIERLLNGT